MVPSLNDYVSHRKFKKTHTKKQCYEISEHHQQREDPKTFQKGWEKSHAKIWQPE